MSKEQANRVFLKGLAFVVSALCVAGTQFMYYGWKDVSGPTAILETIALFVGYFGFYSLLKELELLIK